MAIVKTRVIDSREIVMVHKVYISRSGERGVFNTLVESPRANLRNWIYGGLNVWRVRPDLQTHSLPPPVSLYRYRYRGDGIGCIFRARIPARTFIMRHPTIERNSLIRSIFALSIYIYSFGEDRAFFGRFSARDQRAAPLTRRLCSAVFQMYAGEGELSGEGEASARQHPRTRPIRRAHPAERGKRNR